ncbi:hypothetical protein [Acinetobacter sp. TSRC1-2]|uniref:hypothetical protein n=1 Tax=unclassified Acinetobacter TaxID=196816 RepID=UPI003CF002E4
MKDKVIDILKYIWNPKFDLNNEYEYQHLHDMTNFILDALNDDQREVKISEFLKRNSIEKYQGDISPDKSDSVTSLILEWANPLEKMGEIFTQTTSVFSLYSDQELPNHFSYPSLFAEISENSNDINIGNWEFIDARTESGALAYECRKKEGFNLVPFARLLDWAAYFDGDDINGDPSVFVFDLGDMPHHIKFKNFKDWLDKAPSF